MWANRRVWVLAGLLAVLGLAAVSLVAAKVVRDRRSSARYTAASVTSWPATTDGATSVPTMRRSELSPVPSAAAGPDTVHFPDASSTGVPEGTVLVPAPHGGVWEVDEDVDGVSFTGMILITGPDVRITRSRLVADNEIAAVFNPDGHPGVVVEDSDIVCVAADPPTAAALVGVDVVRRADISGCVDGIKIGPGARVEDNYIHDLAFGEGTHNDGIQLQGGSDIRISGNTIVQVDNGQRQANSAVFIQDTSEPIDRVEVRDNYVNGFGWTLRVMGERVTNTVLADNVIGEDHLWGPYSIDAGAENPANRNLAEGNVRPDGTPIS